MGAVDKMPMKDAWQISQKMAAADAAGGLTVAAVGGSEADIRTGVKCWGALGWLECAP